MPPLSCILCEKGIKHMHTTNQTILCSKCKNTNVTYDGMICLECYLKISGCEINGCEGCQE
jgi:hypothetical protein